MIKKGFVYLIGGWILLIAGLILIFREKEYLACLVGAIILLFMSLAEFIIKEEKGK